ncbi:hypothetical protein PAHAL_4G242200 [Panicum hallii]|jgi:hypothetical protein|uniref:Uncharacterized protein n=1 Tax=Panicum hallii TaxID=206008 RepID=A0A2S3HJU2_9POAL|nr:hypothetical protein PAHAL_4G242200 [Panicum hallii]
MEGQAWEAYYSQLAPRRPSVTKILFDLKTRELASPIFVCLHCTMESQTQQAMASHCRQHVRAGMAKGTVDHIKYYPDHTYDFLCNSPQPKPQAPRSAQQAMPQVPTNRYSQILPYSGSIIMSELARSPWVQLNGHSQHLINIPNMQRHTLVTPIEGSSSSTSGVIMTPNYNEIGYRTTPLPVPPVIDLTLRLGPTPRSISEDSMHGTTFPF